MGQKSIKNTQELTKLIRLRRNELNLTIEAAASKAGVGTKTWSRYEAGESIRKDKIIGICKALNWKTIPLELDSSSDYKINFEEYKMHKAWSPYINTTFGEWAAASFVIGTDILLDYLKDDMDALSNMPCKSHIGQNDYSWLSCMLPKQFLMRYDYDFLYALYSTVVSLRDSAHTNNPIIAHRVIDELALYLIVEASKLLLESAEDNDEYWDGWIYDIFNDNDLIIFLYSDMYLTNDDTYHFDNWLKNQFFC